MNSLQILGGTEVTVNDKYYFIVFLIAIIIVFALIQNNNE